MKTFSLLPYLFIVAGMVLANACKPPYKPDYDVGTGKLIFKTTCQNQTIYLMDIVYLQAYKSGYAYSDTLTMNGTKYTHVVQLDSSQSAFLATRQINDKLSIDFERAGRSLLPACTGFSSTSIERVKVGAITSADYN